jgi:class 3 adenylate cyclase
LDIAAWLRELGLERYVEAFEANDIDTAVLHSLNADDLKELGVTSLGHRKKLLEAIATLGEPAGRPMAAPAEAPRAATAREAERRQLTVMFVDLVGSTALAARLDPEDMREVLRAYQDTCAGVIARFEGFVAKFMGDGVLAYFGYPQAHEDEAERATRAGLALAATIGGLRAPNGDALAARVGIATGLVVVGDLIGEGAPQEQAVVGETPNLAARLQAVAAPGQVVIAEPTRRLLGASFELEDLGEHDLKGIARPVDAFAVTGERSVESRFEARSGLALLPMVGRDQELALLLERWTQAKAGEGQGVLLVGEAGIGKSRISRALLDAVANEPHTRIRYQCSPYHADSPLWPVIQQLSHAAAWVRTTRLRPGWTSWRRCSTERMGATPHP